MANSKRDVFQSLRTEAVEDFLKTVYKLQYDHDPVPTSILAKELDIKPPSVTEMAQKLSDHGLIDYQKYQGLRLTDVGSAIALEVIRYHRLLEMYLIEALGYSWDEVHEEADRLEHVISEQFEARIAAALGHPTQDPHGDPIPEPDGKMPKQSSMTLLDAEHGTAYFIYRITDQSGESLRYFAQQGIIPGSQIIVNNIDEDKITAKVENNAVTLPFQLAESILIQPLVEHS